MLFAVINYIETGNASAGGIIALMTPVIFLPMGILIGCIVFFLLRKKTTSTGVSVENTSVRNIRWGRIVLAFAAALFLPIAFFKLLFLINAASF